MYLEIDDPARRLVEVDLVVQYVRMVAGDVVEPGGSLDRYADSSATLHVCTISRGSDITHTACNRVKPALCSG